VKPKTPGTDLKGFMAEFDLQDEDQRQGCSNQTILVRLLEKVVSYVNGFFTFTIE